MKPPQGVRNYRKKMRNFKRRCRQPCTEIKIGLFVLRLECQSAVPRLKRAPRRIITPGQRKARLDAVTADIVTRKSLVHVPISAWRTGRTDLQNLIKNPPSNPPSPVGPAKGPPGSPRGGGKHPGTPTGIRIKSELKMVTETCTAAVPSPPRHSVKVYIVKLLF